jgi:anti-anti-sigma factor
MLQLPDPGLDDTLNRVELSCPSCSLAVVELVGEHDVGQYKLLAESLLLAASRRRHVLVDLSRCAFIDSTVVSLLLAARDEVTSDHGRFALVIPVENESVVRVADLMGLVDLFTIYSTRDDAWASRFGAAR